MISLDIVITHLFALCKFNIYPIFYNDKSKKKIENYIFLQISEVLKKIAKRNDLDNVWMQCF